jgi:hypothetical protein
MLGRVKLQGLSQRNCTNTEVDVVSQHRGNVGVEFMFAFAIAFGFKPLRNLPSISRGT